MAAKTVDQTKGIYRRIYSGFLTGRRINSVSMEAEAWFWRLQALADDFGVFPADAAVLASHASPRRKVSQAKCDEYTKALVDAGLIRLYTVDGDRFGEIDGFDVFQPAGKNGRRIKKYPSRNEALGNPGESKAIRVEMGEDAKSSAAQAGEDAKSTPPHTHTHSHTHTHPHTQPTPRGGDTARAGGGGGDSADGEGGDWRAETERRMVGLGMSRGKAREFAHHPMLTRADVSETWKAVVNDASIKSRMSVFVRRMQELLGISTERQGEA